MSDIQRPEDLFSFSHVRNAGRLEPARLGALREVASRPEGVKATVDEQLGYWHQDAEDTPVSLGRDDPESSAGVAGHPRIGIGLPMSNIFST